MGQPGEVARYRLVVRAVRLGVGRDAQPWFGVSHNSSRISETERRNDVLQAQVDALADANAKQDQLLQQANQELMRTGGSPLAPPRLVAVSFAADGCAFVFTMSDGSSITSQLPPVLCKE